MARSRSRYWLSLVSLSFGGCAIWLLVYIRYVFYEQMIATLGCTNAQLGALNTFGSMAGLFLPVFSGIIADRFNTKYIIILSLLANSCCSFVFAAFTTYPVAMVVWPCLTLSTGLGYWGSLIKTINSLGKPEEAGRSFSIYYAIYGVLAALINVVEIWAGTKYGFGAAVLVIGSMTTLAAIMDIFFLENPKKRVKTQEEIEAAKAGNRDTIKFKDLRFVLAWPGTYILGLGGFFAYMLYANVSYFNPFLVDIIGIPEEYSSMLSVIRTYFLMLVCPVGGILADKVFHSTAKALRLMGIVSAIILACVFLFKPGANVLLAAVYSLLPSLVIMPLYSINNSIIRELHIHPMVLASTVAVSGYFSTPVDMCSPLVFGYWLDKYGDGGYTFIFLTLIGCAIGLIFTTTLAISHNKKCLAGKRKMVIKE